jgi:putative phosphonate metabolism protein
MRYAIYFATDATAPLMQLGNAWLGRDPFTGNLLEQPVLENLGSDRFTELTGSPRRYGFHGTLKAPFSLAEGKPADALIAACADFAGAVAPFELNSLGVNRLGKFLALTPEGAEPELQSFASLCVRHFEPFRSPLSAEDLERRRQANLTPKQDSYVETWGYPYIFDEFRFHMTLTNKLENEAEAAALTAAAREHFAAVTGKALRCRHFGLYAEPERGAPFEVHTIFELTGSDSPPSVLDKMLAEPREEHP